MEKMQPHGKLYSKYDPIKLSKKLITTCPSIIIWDLLKLKIQEEKTHESITINKIHLFCVSFKISLSCNNKNTVTYSI